jgi:hypothetical protein
MAFPAEAYRLRDFDLSCSQTLTDVFIANLGDPARASAATSVTCDSALSSRLASCISFSNHHSRSAAAFDIQGQPAFPKNNLSD